MALRFILRFFYCAILPLSIQCQPKSKIKIDLEYKIKGLSVVAPPSEIPASSFEPMVQVNANYLCFMPYAFLPADSSKLKYVFDNSTEKQWWGETAAGIKACTAMALQKGLKTMLKPHLWLKGGQFTGDLLFHSKSDLVTFQESYRTYILDYAKLASALKIEMFCVGTELHSLIQQDPSFWIQLITDVKKIYPGTLTYAENWDKIHEVPFWSHLDYIGIDAYFPLSSALAPTKDQLAKSWKKHKKSLLSLSSKYQKPILFTELGYNAQTYATAEPWKHGLPHSENAEIQALAYQTFFDELWEEPWFAGVFIWKWFPYVSNKHWEKDLYSPQNRIAEKVLKENFGKYPIKN
jgi:hypothetical protein